MVIVKKAFFGLCILLFCVACTSEITRLKQTEYLRTQPAKALVYPEGVAKPLQEKTYVIPELPKAAQERTEPESPELLALPPRLAGVDISEDEDDEGDKEPQDQAVETPEEGDEGFLEQTE